MYNVHMLCAGHGDCIWIEYGDQKRIKRMLIDAGTPATYQVALLPKIEQILAKEGRCEFELFVVSHIDEDHIGGAIQFLENLDERVRIKEVWFNGYAHLSNRSPRTLGPAQGERLTDSIQRRGLAWNRRFDELAVMVPDIGPLPQFSFSGMKITLLSPTLAKLQRLEPIWSKATIDAGLTVGKRSRRRRSSSANLLGGDVEAMAMTKFSPDRAAANGTSIAFVAEYMGARVLFSADAHPSVLLRSAHRAPFNGRCELDAFKLPHHGSAKNVSSALLDAFPSSHYLISTNGDRFEHPDEAAIARVVLCEGRRSKTLHFNYITPFNRPWGNRSRKRIYNYEAIYPTDSQSPLLEL